MTSYILVGKYRRFGRYCYFNLLFFNPENAFVTSTNPHGSLLYCIQNFDRSEKLDSRTKKCIMFLKWELISSLELRHENGTIIDTNVQIEDVLVALRPAGTVKVAKYKKL